MVTIRKSENNLKDYFYNYLFLLWDGLGFFGFDDNKLERLNGKKPKWYDRFSNKRWVLLNLILATAFFYIITSQFELIDTIKS
jgi:hypothetical protein